MNLLRTIHSDFNRRADEIINKMKEFYNETKEQNEKWKKDTGKCNGNKNNEVTDNKNSEDSENKSDNKLSTNENMNYEEIIKEVNDNHNGDNYNSGITK